MERGFVQQEEPQKLREFVGAVDKRLRLKR